jgi:hypothetical protein
MKYEDNIKIDLKVIGCQSVDWIQPVQDRNQRAALVMAVMNF